MSIALALWLIATAAGIGYAAGFVYGSHKTAARNAAHVECLGCSHIGPNKALRAAQKAAQEHRAETGHVALVVSK